MKRRTFGLLASSSLLALQTGRANAQSVAPDASQLGTTLTPMGGEMAGNADGSIPAWTGGVTTLPVGVQPGDYVPDMFADEQPLVVIDASNLAEHAALLSEGTQTMLKKYQGFKLKVYPTHRTAAAPQSVYDRIKANVATAKFTDDDPIGGRFGFEGAFGGVPFPIPDVSNPFKAGAQIIWNFNAAWNGVAVHKKYEAWSVSNGQPSLAFSDEFKTLYPYYAAQSLDEFNNKYKGLLYQEASPYTGPANLVGQNIIIYAYSNPYKHPQQAWELLNGQGRVRRAPEISFDTPSSQSNGIIGYDEYYGFNGSLERYDWKYLGKQEMYIPYNNNGLLAASPQEALQENYVNPDLVRFEKHRCWVVEATLHPGERNVLARRRFYVDEDTWSIGVVDAWDGENKLFKCAYVYTNLQPALPGLIYGQNVVNNLQTDDYVAVAGTWNKSRVAFLDSFPASLYDPNNMAASAQY